MLLDLQAFLWFGGTAGLLGSLWVLFNGRNAVRHTSLGQAWGWAFAGVLLWLVAWMAGVLGVMESPAVADQFWLLVANVLLCAMIAVLGARRPTSHVWSWFILLPLLVVLEWPALVDWNRGTDLAPLQIPAPALFGFGLVLVMGVGNYVGTRFAYAMLLLGGAMLMIVAPMSGVWPASVELVERLRIWATVAVTISALTAQRAARRSPGGHSPVERLWLAFRDFYGLVWTQRLQDRVNETARQEGWPVRLERDGVVWTVAGVDQPTRLQGEQRLEQTLRWLLRRFVDADWIDGHLSVSRG